MHYKSINMASRATFEYKGHRIEIKYNNFDNCYDYETYDVRSTHELGDHNLIFVSDDIFHTIDEALETAKYEIDSLFS